MSGGGVLGGRGRRLSRVRRVLAGGLALCVGLGALAVPAVAREDPTAYLDEDRPEGPGASALVLWALWLWGRLHGQAPVVPPGDRAGLEPSTPTHRANFVLGL